MGMAEVKAARICLQAPLQLLATDDEGGLTRTAEQSVLAGTQVRFEAITTFLELGAEESALLSLVTGEGRCGTDRLLAIWWESLTPSVFRRCVENPFHQLNEPVSALVNRGLLTHRALVICQEKDSRRADRERFRAELAEYQAALVILARTNT